MKLALLGLGAGLALASCQSAGAGERLQAHAAPLCAAGQADAVAHAIRSFYSALARQDYAAAERLTTGSFHAFEVGKRYDRAGFTKMLVDAHAAGRVFEWTIGPVAARIDCTVASANWENKGSAGTAQQRRPMSWLESATLVREGNVWLIDFLHSTPKDPR